VTSWNSGSAGAFNNPTAVAVGPDGTVYVVDSANNRIQRSDANGGPLSAWGSGGSLDGQFNAPRGIATGPDGSVYVTDLGNNRVEQFFADGTFVRSFTSGAGTFSQVTGIAASPAGDVYVVDSSNTRVEHFDANGVFQGAWGSAGTGDGQFQAPNGIAASAASVYVADSSQNRIQKFTPTGAFVDSLDAASSGDTGLAQPFAVAVSAAGLLYAVGSGGRVSSYTETGTTTLPPPTTGETANAQPVQGTVKVKKPGSDSFQLLAAGQQIPIGSIIDVTKGVIDLTTTQTTTATQTARFFAGVFKLTQPKATNPITELQLFGGNFRKACPKPRSRRSAVGSAKKKVVRQLWGIGKGSFRTKGKYASATVRGTQWNTSDRCDGTLIRVNEGSVTVRDFVKKTNVVVSAPKTYLAKAKVPKKR
jgi:sugar lactone lactonase YvrE